MKYQINLLGKRKEKTFDRVIYFALNYLRYILVMTQIVVIMVFLSKLSIDQKIIDLQESVDQKKEIVTVSQPLLDEAKKADFETRQIEAVLNNQDRRNDSIDYALAQFPSNMFMKRMQVDSDSMDIEAIITDIQTVKAYVQRLQKENKFKTVRLLTISKTDEGLEALIELKGFGISPQVTVQ